MTVLNTANDGFYNVLVVLYRALAVYGKMPRERLLELCTPGLPDPVRLRQTLNRWRDLGLFVETDGQVAFAPEAQPRASGPKGVARATEALPAVLRKILFADRNNERFWDSTASLSADFSRGLAWLLAQDIYAIRLGRRSEVQLLEGHQITDADRRIVQNDVRLGGLIGWASYLGFLWQTDEPMVDPTAALRQDLPVIFGPGRELSASDFILRAASVLPVLDEGRYRVQVEAVLNPAEWRRPARPDILSTALSRALWRLEAAKVLLLEQRADAGDSRTLQGRDGQEWRRFTHVRLGGIAA